MEKQIKDLIEQALKELSLPHVDFSIEHPQIETYGDFATNVAMVLFPQLKKEGNETYKSPRDLAQAIADKLPGSVAVAGPGFINITLDTKVFLEELQQILDQKENYGKTNILAGKKVSVEYTDPNPFKELHLGHLYSNLIGEAIAHAFEANGATVWRADFYGDTGLHVAKSVWGMLHKLKEENINLDELAAKNISIRQSFLGKCYAYGVVKFENDEQVKDEITHLNTLVWRPYLSPG